MATMRRIFEKVWPAPVEDNVDEEPPLSHSKHDGSAYNSVVDEIREKEYPTLTGTTYLDHAGTTPYAKSAIEGWTAELTTNLFGNPHSASASSQLSTRRIDDVRLKVLKFLNANPDDFDVVFVANATAALKLVLEAFRDESDCGGFHYRYHADAHTSLVGGRELAQSASVFEDDHSFEEWISKIKNASISTDRLQLVAYPGQSNMTGRKIPMAYCEQIRQRATRSGRRIYTLLDVASLASTSPLDLSRATASPDFLALSFYKIFGFPDLGALIVRKDSAELLTHKRYFAGGTVDGVALPRSSDDGWHVKKETIHSALEEGTLPFHNILALDHAMDVHTRLFGSMKRVSQHCNYLAREAKDFLRRIRHGNGGPVCEIYDDTNTDNYGPIVAFNLKDASGSTISASEVEKLGIVKGFQMRTGGLCNPGGIARYLSLSKEEVKSNYDAGRRCGGDSLLINGKPSGVIRISFGAMSTKTDLQRFMNFIEEYYVERDVLSMSRVQKVDLKDSPYLIKGLSVYPIKSCAAFEVPASQRWELTTKGLAWDREWCLVHEGTNAALSQKRYPRMALLQPIIDLAERKLRVCYTGDCGTETIEVDLDETPTLVTTGKTCDQDVFKLQKSRVCGDTIPIHVYSSIAVKKFFSSILGVPCCLARYPRDTLHSRTANIRKPSEEATSSVKDRTTQLMLSNESPILIVSTASVVELNRQIVQNASAAMTVPSPQVSASSFRANIIVAPRAYQDQSLPYVEDNWRSLTISPAGVELSTHRYESRSLQGRSSSDGKLHYISNITDNCTDEKAGNTHDNNHQDDDDLSLTNSIPGSFSFSTSSPSSSISSPTSNPRRDRASSSPPIKTSSNHSEHDQDRQDEYLTEARRDACSKPVHIDILGPCQRCQMLSINQTTGEAQQQEPFSTLSKTRRKGDGRVWFGVHAALSTTAVGGVDDIAVDDESKSKVLSKEEREEQKVYVQVGDEVIPEYH